MKYERLTETEKINKYCSTVECGEHCEDCYVGNLYERLAELEDKIERGELVENTVVTYVNMGRCNSKTLIDKALKYDELKTKIENGTLIELPCKVGDRIWCIINKKHIFGRRIKEIIFKKNRWWIQTVDRTGWADMERFYMQEFNKTVFLTKAEAEKKLKELKGEV